MPKKDTEELEEALSEARDVRDYFDENADEFSERTLAEELARLLAEKHLTKSLVAERSGLDRTYAYHIFDGKKPHPAREKVLALALSLGLTPKEAQHLLYYARCPRLYVRDAWDSIVWHALEKGLSVTEANLLLEELGEKSLLG